MNSCTLKDTCKGYDFCWYGDCVLKNVYEKVTEKAPSNVHYVYRDILKAVAKGRNIFLTACGGCLTGDTIIRYNRASLGRKTTLKHLYEAHKGIAKYKKWNKDITTKVRSYIEEKDCIMLNDVQDIVYSGKKEVYLLLLEDGKSLKATKDHKIMTVNGFVELQNLTIGTNVMVDNIAEKKKKDIKNSSIKKLKDKRICVGKYHPYARTEIYNKRKNPSYRIEIHRAIYEASINNLSLEDFCKKCKEPNDLIFVDTTKYCIHHIDGNHYNNEISNLTMLTHSEHYKLHGNYKSFGYGLPKYSRVKSITYVGVEDTYDICCYENHNFNANDIIVHNSGKSFFLDHLCNALAGKVTVTATTGIAALNVGGATIHSTLGLGLGKTPVKTMIQKLTPYKQDFLNRIQILAIDEVSMLSGELLDKCNEFLKLARMDNRPFGGVQVILIGDFCQLPPVDDENQTKDYCFFSNTWKELNLACYELKHNFRQQDDPEYAEILRNLRNGELNEQGYNLIMSKTIDNPPNDVPRLYATNKEVYEYNMAELKNIGNEIKVFNAEYSTPNENIRKNKSFYDSLVEKMKKNSIVEDELSLCEGARIMLTRNLDLEHGLVNGSLGYVRTFCDDGSIAVEFDNGEERYIKISENDMHDAEGKVILTQTQYPLKLANAITIHKVQGQTLDKVFIDFDRFFEVNQAYVALSRVKKSDGLYVKNFRTTALKFSPIVLDFYRALNGEKNVGWLDYTYDTIKVSKN